MPRERARNGRLAINVRAFQAEASWCAEVIFSPSLLLTVSLKGPISITEPVSLLPSGRRSPPPKLLSSDDESSPPTVPTSLRSIPHFYPNLPPKHTYLRTPVRIPILSRDNHFLYHLPQPSPPRRQALPSLEKKLKNASLVQESLQNLLLATEDVVGPDDGEILGSIVNWEGTVYPRKRWKLSA